jgi:hypothetical protein
MLLPAGSGTLAQGRTLNTHLLWLLTVMAICMRLSMAQAEPVAPSSLPNKNLTQSLAQLLVIPPEQVVEVRGFDLRSVPGISGVVLGRYREKGRAWTHPVLGVFHVCPAGTCISVLRLGQAAERLAPLALVDLDRPAAPVTPLSPVYFRASVPEPTEQVRWPVLLIASEVQDSEPSSGPSPPQRRSGAHRVEQQLYLLSLREGNAPQILHQRTLFERWPESEDGRERAPSRVGRRIEGLLLGRHGQDIVMHVTERDIDSSYSHCLRPEPSVQRHRLVGLRFEVVGAPAGQALGGCR